MRLVDRNYYAGIIQKKSDESPLPRSGQVSRDIGNELDMTSEISIELIKPNDWNPNQMTDDEFIELVEEIRHLGQPPKPIVLRRNGAGYEIVDGEHAYKALMELDAPALKEGWYEVINADDFEAMRQTYKRNQHGTHDPLKQGRLFVRMMTERGLSQSALAREVSISEGTVRNSLEYVKALEARNSYEGWYKTEFERMLSLMSVRQVRALNRLPIQLGDLWLRENLAENQYPRVYPPSFPDESALYDFVPRFNCGPIQAVEKLNELNECLRMWGRKQKTYTRRGIKFKWVGGKFIDIDEAFPYIKAFTKSRWFRNFDKIGFLYIKKVLEAITRPEGDKAVIVLPLETFQAWIDYPEQLVFHDFRDSLRARAEELAGPQTDEEQFWDSELANYAPPEIRDADLSTAARYDLWQTQKTYIDEGKDKGIIARALTKTIELVEAMERRAAKLRTINTLTFQQKKELIAMSKPANEMFDKELRVLLQERETEDTLKDLGDKKNMLDLVSGKLAYHAQIFDMFGGEKKAAEIRAFMQPVLDRLDALPEPELALLAAMLLGRHDYLEIWMKALDWKFPEIVDG